MIEKGSVISLDDVVGDGAEGLAMEGVAKNGKIALRAVGIILRLLLGIRDGAVLLHQPGHEREISLEKGAFLDDLLDLSFFL